MGAATGHPTQYDPVIRTVHWLTLALIAAICVLPLLALGGTFLPARRAATINPVSALRSE